VRDRQTHGGVITITISPSPVLWHLRRRAMTKTLKPLGGVSSALQWA
jgi:hypothetical protein